MCARKYEEHHIRKLSKMGNASRGITLPAHILRSLGWREGQKLSVKEWGEGILIEDWKEEE